MHIKPHSYNTVKYTSRHSMNQVGIWFICAVMILLAGCQLGSGRTITDDRYTDIFMNSLKKQGFEPNIGFTPKYTPGTIIQVISRDQNGKPFKEVMPRVFFSSEECYPNVKTKVIDAVLPGVRATRNGGFQLNSKLMDLFIPSLNIDNTEVENYTMVINKPKVLLMSKGSMIGQMSKKCSKALTQALRDGDKIEYYRIIDEVMAADGFSFKLAWAATSGFEIGYRKNIQQQLLDQFSMTADDKSTSASLSSTNESKSFSELKTDNRVFFAYKSRAINKSQ